MIKLFIIFFLLISTSSYATFTDLTNLGSGAKNIALGKTQSTDQTPYSIFANPAGISGIDRMSIASMYSSVLDDINYSIFGVAIPIKDGNYGVISFAGISTNISGIERTTSEVGSGSIGSTGFSDTLMILSYAKELRDYLDVGGAFKFYSGSMGSVKNASVWGFDVDAGMIFYPKEKLSFGVVFQNIIFGRMFWGTQKMEDVPATLKMGFDFKPNEMFNLLVDYDSNNSIHAGIAYRDKSIKWLSLRAGADSTPVGNLESSTNYSLGVGLDFSGITLDYAYSIDPVFGGGAGHYFSFSFIPPEPLIESPAALFASKSLP